MKLRYLVKIKEGTPGESVFRSFNTMKEAIDFHKTISPCKIVILYVNQIKDGIWTAGTLQIRL